MSKDTKTLLLAVLVSVEVILAVLASRDLRGRTDSEIRGKRAFWRWSIRANPGNALVYWAIARR